ncbi:MAG: DUF971 domain-containing protein [Bacteroidota bacterium]
MIPNKINITSQKNLEIVWNDAATTVVKLASLRNNCPCAVCKSEKEEFGSTYIPIYNNDQIAISKITPVGNYAVTISWKDGHDTGIYEFGFLRTISKTKEISG